MSVPTDSARHRVVIIDDHPIVRHGLAAVLNRAAGLQVVGEADDAPTGYALVQRSRPDVVILDLSLPGASGLDLIHRIARAYPQCAVLVVSMLHQDDYAERCMAAGARGYIMKEEASELIVEGVLAVLGGRHFARGAAITPGGRAAARPADPSTGGVEGLSNVEMEVLRLLGEGRSTAAIAQLIHKSPKTVELHRSRIRARLGIKTANELIAFAARWLGEQQRQVPRG